MVNNIESANSSEKADESVFKSKLWLWIGEPVYSDDGTPEKVEVTATDKHGVRKHGLMDIEAVELWEQDPFKKFEQETQKGELDYGKLPPDAVEELESRIDWDE